MNKNEKPLRGGRKDSKAALQELNFHFFTVPQALQGSAAQMIVEITHLSFL